MEDAAAMVQSLAVPVAVLCVAAAGWWMRGDKKKKRANAPEDVLQPPVDSSCIPTAELPEHQESVRAAEAATEGKGNQKESEEQREHTPMTHMGQSVPPRSDSKSAPDLPILGARSDHAAVERAELMNADSEAKTDAHKPSTDVEIDASVSSATTIEEVPPNTVEHAEAASAMATIRGPLPSISPVALSPGSRGNEEEDADIEALLATPADDSAVVATDQAFDDTHSMHDSSAVPAAAAVVTSLDGEAMSEKETVQTTTHEEVESSTMGASEVDAAAVCCVADKSCAPQLQEQACVDPCTPGHQVRDDVSEAERPVTGDTSEGAADEHAAPQPPSASSEPVPEILTEMDEGTQAMSQPIAEENPEELKHTQAAVKAVQFAGMLQDVTLTSAASCTAPALDEDTIHTDATGDVSCTAQDAHAKSEEKLVDSSPDAPCSSGADASDGLDEATSTAPATEDSASSLQEADDVASTPTYRPSEEELTTMFRKHMRDGLKLHRHYEKFNEEVVIKVKHRTLAIKAGFFKRKKNVLPLREVDQVLTGKRSDIFRASNAQRLADGLCFSLVTKEGTSYDFEAETELDRDALVTGFLLYLESYRNPQRRFTLSSNASLATTSSESTEA